MCVEIVIYNNKNKGNKCVLIKICYGDCISVANKITAMKTSV